MTSGAPWSVKGIDPKAREVAKDLARRSGMTLGEWLNRMILVDEGPDEITSQAYFEARPRAEALQAPVVDRSVDLDRVSTALDRLSRFERDPRPSPAALAAEKVMADALARIEAAERQTAATAARFEGAMHEARSENSRLAERLRKVETAAAGPRSAEALRSLETALGRIAGHLHEGENRTRETIREVERRIDEIVANGVADPAGLIEEVVNRVDARLNDAETRTEETLSALSGAFGALESRIARAEAGLDADLDGRIAGLSAQLTRRLEDSRAEFAQGLGTDSAGRFDRIEQQLGEMAQSVRHAEQVSTDAAEKMGREVLALADALNRQVQAVEHRSADAIEQVGGEVARIAEAMESRLGRSEGAHAEALEKLGAEISRITDRLTERIGSSERRAAQAIDDVGDQVARVSERISQRQERSVEDLAERIRLSEERTARLLDEAREKIDRSLAESQRRLLGEPDGVQRMVREEPAPSTFAADPFSDLDLPEPEPEPRASVEPPLNLQAFAGPTGDFDRDAEEPDIFVDEADVAETDVGAGLFSTAEDVLRFAPEDYEAADNLPPPPEEGFGLDPEPPHADDDAEPTSKWSGAAFAQDRADPFAMLDEAGASEAEAPAKPLTTREVIEQARAAARSATAPAAEKTAKVEKLWAPKDKPKRAKDRSLFSGLSLRKRGVGGGSLQTALLVAGGAAFLTVGAASYFVAEAEPGGATPDRVAAALDIFAKDKAGEIKSAEADTTPTLAANPAPRAAVALVPQTTAAAGQTAQAPTPAPAQAGAATAAGAESAEVTALYASALRAIETGQPGGLDDLRKAANLGHSPAQFYLAKLYAEGGAGLKQDLAASRRWTQRAAEGGNRTAMHNLGIALAEGQGGPANAVLAAQWFRRAADLGLVDSQFNLGVLNEQGRGVVQNTAEAYKWYLIAAKGGDEPARRSAARVRANLTPEGRELAERSAQAFRAAPSNPSSRLEAAAPTRSDLATAQRALSRLDYYQGPTDGSASPALAMAIAAYQRNEGMAATGKLDPLTLSRLKVFTR